VSTDAAKRITRLVDLATARTVQAVDEVASRLTALELPDAVLGRELTSRIRALTETISDAERGFSDLRRVVGEAEEAVPSLAGAMRQVHDSAAAATRPLEVAAGQSEQLRSAVAKLCDALESSTSLVRAAHADQLASGQQMTHGIAVIADYQERLSALSASLTNDLKASEDAVRKVHQNLIAATQFVTQRVQ
jgi:chromosome segregation ATPase